MRKSLLLFILLSLVIPLSVKAEEDLVKLVREIQPAVVTVLTYDREKKPLGQGSGFFINKKGHLITNYHVLKQAYRATVKIFDGKEYPVKLVLAENKTTDLIKLLVRIPKKAIRFVKVAKITPKVAERVLVVGSPLGLEQTVSEGIVSAVRDIPTIGKLFQISAPISSGSSGSPVLNMKGQVIGVATFQFIEGQNLNFAISGEQVLALETQRNERTLAEWTSGISEEQIELAGNLVMKGIDFYLAYEHEKALDCFKKAIDIDKKDSSAWILIGSCYSELGHFQEAIGAYKQAIRIKPNDATAHLSLGFVYGKLSRHAEEIEAYKQAIRIKPDYADGHLRLGIAYGELGRLPEAVVAFKQAIRIKPEDADAYHNLGHAYNSAGSYQDAIVASKQAIQFDPDYAEAHYNLGHAYYYLGRYQKAIESFKQVIRIKPDYADAHYFLGIVFNGLGHFREAIEAYKQAIRIKPDHAEAYLSLGAIYVKLNRDHDQEAIEAFKQVIRIKPDYAQAHLNLGITYLFVGNKIAALKEYKILKDLDKELANELFSVIYDQ